MFDRDANFWAVARCGWLPCESFYKVLKSTFLKVETVFASIACKSVGEAGVVGYEH